MMVGETFTTQLDAVNNDRHFQPSNKDHFDDDLLPSYELADTIMRGIRDIELSLTTSEIHHQSSSIEKHGPHRYGDSNNSSSNKDRMYNFGMEEDEVIVPPLGRKEIRVKRSKSNNRMIGAAFIVDDNHSDDSNDDKDDDDDHNGNDNHIPSSIKKSFIRSSRLRDRSLSSSLLLHTARNNNNNNTHFMDFTRISFNPNSIENRAYASKRTLNVTSTTTHATTATTTATSTSAVVTTTSTVLPTTESISSPSHVSHKQSQSITDPQTTAPISSSTLVLSL